MNDTTPTLSSSEEFDSLLRSTRKDGIDDLIAWLHGTDFYEAPASTRFHGAYKKGLIYHSLAVYDCAVKIARVADEVKDFDFTDNELIIAALLHDICKANTYSVYKKNVKIDGVWIEEEAYKFDEKFCFGGHGSKSVYLAQNYIHLTPNEATAINCHMGFTDTNNLTGISNAYSNCHLAWVIHVADEMSTFICDL